MATPVGVVADEVRRALAAGTGLVTDVGSVKTPMLELMDDPRYVGGHPMAGSELEGVEGSRADLFEGATWVLTPVSGTDDAAFTRIRSLVASLGASVVAIPPDRHDSLVATVSHVPHLTAATMMRLAAERSEEHRAVLRLAAGGFRDMTRIAAGHPGIWPDICAENRRGHRGRARRPHGRPGRGPHHRGRGRRRSPARGAGPGSPRPGQPAGPGGAARGPGRAPADRPRPRGGARPHLHAGHRPRRQHRRLRGGPLHGGSRGRADPGGGCRSGRAAPGRAGGPGYRPSLRAIE